LLSLPKDFYTWIWALLHCKARGLFAQNRFFVWNFLVVLIVYSHWIIIEISLFDAKIVIFLDVRVKPVFDSIFWSTRKTFTNLTPLWAHLDKQFNYSNILLFSPLLTSNCRVELVNESLSNLFPRLCSKYFCNDSPIMSYLVDHFENNLIFLGAPNLFILSETTYPPEPMETLVLISIFHLLGDDVPFFWVVFVEFNKT